MSEPTHALVLAAEMGATVVEFIILRGDLTKTTKAYSKWLKDVETKDWIKIPGELPVAVKSRTVVGLRIVEIPAEVLKSEKIQKKWAGDPRRNQWMNQFMNQAQGFSSKLEEASGTDLLDKGYKGD